MGGVDGSRGGEIDEAAQPWELGLAISVDI